MSSQPGCIVPLPPFPSSNVFCFLGFVIIASPRCPLPSRVSHPVLSKPACTHPALEHQCSATFLPQSSLLDRVPLHSGFKTYLNAADSWWMHPAWTVCARNVVSGCLYSVASRRPPGLPSSTSLRQLIPSLLKLLLSTHCLSWQRVPSPAHVPPPEIWEAV